MPDRDWRAHGAATRRILIGFFVFAVVVGLTGRLVYWAISEPRILAENTYPRTECNYRAGDQRDKRQGKAQPPPIICTYSPGEAGEHSGKSEKDEAAAPGAIGGIRHYLRRTFADPVSAFTFVLAISTIGLWWATWLAIRHGREASERELRAYVVIEPGGLEGLAPDKPATAIVRVRNCGKTPAYDLKLGMAAQTRPYPPEGFDPADYYKDFAIIDRESALGPGRKIVLWGGTQQPIPADERVKIVAGDLCFLIYGFIRYRDAFHARRTTYFAHVYRGPITDRKNSRFLERGNGAD